MLVSDLLKNSARKWPDEEAIYCLPTGKRFSYADLNQRVNRLCAWLLEKGLEKGDRIGVISGNCHVHPETLMAAAKCGWVLAEIDHRLSAEEMGYLIADADPKIVIVDSRLAGLLRPVMASFPRTRCLYFPEAYEEGLENASAEARADEATGEDLLTIMYTSGTTGRPKGVMYTHNNLISALVNLAATVPFSHHDRGLHTSPFSHIAPLWPFLLNCHYGATNVIADNSNASYLLSVIENEGITTWNTVPVMISRILETSGKEAFDISSLRWVCYGASAIPVPTLKEALEFFGGIMNQVYGCTETYILTFLEAVEHKVPGGSGSVSRLESCGLPLLNTQTCVVNRNGKMVHPGEIGEIITRGPHVSPGYWKQRDATLESIRDGWYFTGDLATVDDEGFLYIQGRSKEIIVTGGENVSPKEVENVLHTLGAVREAAVVGVPHEKWGEAVTAFVVLKEACTVSEKDLLAYCRDRLAGYKRPKRIVFVDELSRTTSGKVLKRKLLDGMPVS